MKAVAFRHYLIAGAAVFALFGCGSTTSTTDHSRIRTLNALIPPPGNKGLLVVTASSVSLSGTGGVRPQQFAYDGFYVAVPAGTFSPSATGAGLPAALTF